MKKLMIGMAMAISMVVTGCGCKSLPTPEAMYGTSAAIGMATGMVANQVEMDKDVKTGIIDVLNIVSQVVPEVDQTFEDAWMPIAKVHIDKLVADGKITAAQGQLIKSAFTLVVKGVDYVFIRWPEAKKYENLVVSAIDGFNSGFLGVFKPENCTNCCIERGVMRNYDKKAYEYLKSIKIK